MIRREITRDEADLLARVVLAATIHRGMPWSRSDTPDADAVTFDDGYEVHIILGMTVGVRRRNGDTHEVWTNEWTAEVAEWRTSTTYMEGDDDAFTRDLAIFKLHDLEE